MKLLRHTTPVARKEHRCMFCGDLIKPGEQYDRATMLDDDGIYDWIAHAECIQLAHALHLFSDREGGLTDEQFCAEVQDYVRENHYDDRLGDIAQDWYLPIHGLVKKILQELSIADRTVEGGEK